jgi:hypothetical protein
LISLASGASVPSVGTRQRCGGQAARLPRAPYDAEDFEQNDLIEAAAANPRLYGDAKVWIDVGTEDPFRSADEALAKRLAGERLVLWKGGHDFSHFERDAPRVMKFYADALQRC